MALAPAPELRQSDRLSRLRAPLGLAAGVTLAAAALRLRDPHQHGSWGLCPLNALTGLNCPGCGGLRAVNDLTHGQVQAAAQSNALLIGLLPLVVLAWVLWVRHRWSSDGPLLRPSTTRVVTAVLITLAVGFAVLRNTPWGQGLSVS